MNRTTLSVALVAGLIGLFVTASAMAHEGHKHGKQKKKQTAPLAASPRAPGSIGSRNLPFPRRGNGQHDHSHHGHSHFGRDGHHSHGFGRASGTIRGNNPRGINRKPRDLRTTVVRLEFAAEIVVDEISFEIPRSRFREHILKLAANLEKQIVHFHSEMQRAADADHVRKDFDTLAASFTALSQAMRHAPRAFLTNRALTRAGRLLGDISRQLKGKLPGNAPRLPVPGQEAKPISIPKNMKGIALLPRADQAAALAQKTCPVTGDLLGSDGKPLTVQVRGKKVFVCCKACVKELNANPRKFLGKRP